MLPSAYIVKTSGKEPISLAGLVNVAPGRDVKVDLESFSDENAVKLNDAVQGAIRNKLITVLKVQQRGLAGGGLPAYQPRKIEKDTVVRKANQPAPTSTGIGASNAKKDTIIREPLPSEPTRSEEETAKEVDENSTAPRAVDPDRVVQLKEENKAKQEQSPKIPEAEKPASVPPADETPVSEAPPAPPSEEPPAPEAPPAAPDPLDTL